MSLVQKTLSSRSALKEAFAAPSPFSDNDLWEFDSHLIHLQTVLKVLKDFPPNAEVIDVGCYIGILPLALRMLDVNASGNDKYIFHSKEEGRAYGFSTLELDTLQSIWKKYGLVIDAIGSAPSVSQKQYDVVLSIATIEHQPYPKLFLENVASYAKSNGVIYLSTPNVAKLANRVRFLLGRPPMHNVEEFYMNGETFNGHWREYTLGELVQMAHMSNLRVKQSINIQTESVLFKLNRPKKWARSVARLLARFVPNAGDTNVLVLQKGALPSDLKVTNDS